MIRLRRSDAWLGGFGVLLFLSFPQPVLGGVLDLGWLASWFAPAALLLGIRELSPAQAAKRALVAGTLANAAVLHWLYVVTVVYGHAPVVAGVLAPLGVGLVVGCFVAVFAASTRWLSLRGVTTPLAPALVWTALEHLRAMFPASGFPWATLGYAQHENAALLGLSTLTGVYGLSFVTVLGGATFSCLADRAGPRARDRNRNVAVGAIAVAMLAALGLAQIPSDPPAAPTLRVAALQGNVDQGVKWSREWAGAIMQRYSRLTREAAAQGARLVVWPETAVPGAIEFDAGLDARLAELARETGSALVVGGVGIEAIPGRADQYLFFDSAYLYSGDGARSDRYDKTHLVPFGEYVPLRSWLGRFVGAIASGIAPGDVTPGEAPRSVVLPLSEPEAAELGETRAGVPICYELLFPDLVRRFAKDGGRLLLAITNDAWYGRTGAPYQFLAMTALRSAESGLWTVRAANTGVSAIIDAHGRVLEQTAIFEQDLLVADVALRASGDPGTFYVRHGDVFAWGCWLGWAVLLGKARTTAGRGAAEGSSDE